MSPIKQEGYNIKEDNYVIFKLWKQIGRPERLLKQEARFKILENKGPYVFNLFKPYGRDLIKKVENLKKNINGDIVFEVIKDEESDHTIMHLKAIEGGLSMQNVSGFIAPEAGYETHYDIDVTKGDITRTFFISSRGGKVYTRAVLNFWYDKVKGWVVVRIDYSTNPMGSRNLQFGGKRYEDKFLKKFEQRDWARKDFSDINEWFNK